MENINNTQQNSEKKTHSFIKIAVIVAIVIVSNLFFNYAVSLIFNEPVNDTYATNPQVVEPILTKEKCITVGGQWTESISPVEKGKTEIIGSCFEGYTKQKNYDAAIKVYNRNVFITLVVVGVLMLVLSSFIGVSLLSIAFAWSGILSLIIASMRYWSDANNWAKLIILGLALCLLIWVTIKRFNK